MANGSGWIGVDLDGTLAHYEGWKGVGHIGDPVGPMLERVKAWRANDAVVKIFTARVYGEAREIALPAIEAWMLKHLGEVLEVTCTKDFGMIELWDDRAVQVVMNTGRRADGVDG